MNSDFEEMKRLHSFTGRLEHFEISTVLLAHFGFKSISDISDAVECVFCGISREGWKKEDDIKTIHTSHSPSCPVLTQNGENIPLEPCTSKSFENYFKRIETSSIHTFKEPETDETLKNRSTTSTALVPRQENLTKKQLGFIFPKVRFPNAIKKKNRLKSFPENFSRMKSSRLSEAGFFYLGPGDEVRCFSCGIQLMNFTENTNGWIVHAMRNKDCEYVHLMMGSEFINNVTQLKEENNTRQLSILAEEIELHNEDKSHQHLVCSSCRLNNEQVAQECGHIVCVECALELICKESKFVSSGLIRITLPR